MLRAAPFPTLGVPFLPLNYRSAQILLHGTQTPRHIGGLGQALLEPNCIKMSGLLYLPDRGPQGTAELQALGARASAPVAVAQVVTVAVAIESAPRRQSKIRRFTRNPKI